MKKIKSVLTALLLGSAVSGFAQTDVTSKASETWENSGGNYTPAAGDVTLREKYYDAGSVGSSIGQKIMFQKLTGMDQGFYEIELYANAIYTPERGIATEGECGEHNRTFIYATGNGETTSVSIPIQYGIIISLSQTAKVTAYVGADGALEFGMRKDLAGSNWHSIGVKSITYYGDNTTTIKDVLSTEISTATRLTVAETEKSYISTAIATAQSIYDKAEASFTEVYHAVKELKIAEKYALNGFSSATTENPVSAPFIENGEFDSFTNNWPTGGWTTSMGVGNHGQMDSNIGANGKWWENYSWGNERLSGKIFYTIKDIPNGAYTLTIGAFCRVSTSAYVFANSAKQTLTAANETYAKYTVPVVVKNNTLEVGLYAGKEDWCGIDEVSLVYTGDPMMAYKKTIGELISKAEGLDMSNIPDVVSTDVTADVNKYKPEYNSYTEEDDFTSAISELEASVGKAEAYISAYANAIVKMKDILSKTNLYTTDAYNKFYAYIEKFEKGELTAEEATLLKGTVFGTGWRSTAAIDDFLISAWDVNPRTWDTYHVNTWSTKDDSGNPNLVIPAIEYWTGDGEKLANKVLKANVGDLNPADIYTVTMTVCVARSTSDSNTPTGITLQVADGTSVNVCTGAQINDTRFYEGTFTAEGRVDIDGNLVIKLNVENTNISWLMFRDVKYTFKEKAAVASEEQINSIKDAIIGATEGITFGFDKDEYAPYKNVSQITTINNANKFVELAEPAEYFANKYLEELNSLTWNINTEEVNAVYNGDFANTPSTAADFYTTGWIRTNGWGQIQTGVEHASSGFAYYNQPGNLQYGNSELIGHTMPLKANTVYLLTFKYAAWDKNTSVKASVLNSNNEGMQVRQYASTDKNYKDGFINASAVFMTGEAGNYVLTLNNNVNIVITDVVLKKAVKEELVIDEAATYTPADKYADVTLKRTLVEGWNGLVLPFDMTVEDVKTTFNASAVKAFSSIANGENAVTLGFEDATTVSAGQPVMIKATAGSEYIIENVLLSADAALKTVAKEDGTAKFVFTGTYAPTTLTDVSFVLINGTKYYYHEAGTTATSAKAFRGYFVDESTEASAAKSVIFDFNEATGIENVNAAINNADNGAVYDLQGRRVVKPSKGIYVANGKKVVIK